MKRKLLVMSLIFSVISVFYMFLSYYGINRYMFLQMFPNSSYVETYKKLSKIDKNRVVVVLHLQNKKDIEKMKPTLNSILDQTVKVDNIILLTHQNNKDFIPKKEKDIFTIRYYEKEYKNPSFACSMLTEPEAQTKIILVSPSVIYGNEFIENMIEKSNKNSKYVIMADKKDPSKGILFRPCFFTENDIDKNTIDLFENSIGDVCKNMNWKRFL